MYPPKLQLNKANVSDTESPLLDLDISVSNGFVSTNIYNKLEIFYFDMIVLIPFLDGDVPRRPSNGVYILQLIRLDRVCSHVTELNARNKKLTDKHLHQGYRYHKLRKPSQNTKLTRNKKRKKLFTSPFFSCNHDRYPMFIHAFLYCIPCKRVQYFQNTTTTSGHMTITAQNARARCAVHPRGFTIQKFVRSFTEQNS